MRLRRKIAAIAGVVILGLGGAVALESPASASAWGPYLVKNESTGYCLGIPSYSYSAGAQFQLDACDHAPAFYFIDTNLFPYEYYIQVIYDGYYVQPGAPALQNSTLIQWDYSGLAEQMWKLVGASNGAVLIQRVGSASWCMLAESSSLYAYVRQNNCNLLSRWVLVSV